MSKWNKATLLLIILLVALPIFVSCAPKAPAGPATPAPVSTLASAPAKTIELKFSTALSPQHHAVKNVMDRWAKEVEARTKGGVKVTMYTAGALGKIQDHYDMVSKGIAEVGHFLPTYTAGRFPMTTITEIPFYGDHIKSTNSLNELYNKTLYKEFPEVKMILIWGPPLDIGSKKSVKTMEDFKGLKTRTTGGYVTKSLEALGATPVTMPVTEIYTSIERGVVDAFTLNYDSWPGYKLQEVAKNVAVVGISLPINGVIMNINTWNSLPPDIQKVIEGVNKDALKWTEDTYTAEKINAKDLLEKAGVNFYYLPDAEKTRWKNAVAPLWNEWEKEMNGKGLQGTQIRKDFEAILKKNNVN